MRRAVVALVAVVALAGCGGSSGAAPTAASSSSARSEPGLWLVEADGRRAQVSGDARVRGALAAVEREIGGAFSVAVDAALVPPARPAMEKQAALSLEQLAETLGALGKDRPELLRFHQGRLRALRVRYDPADTALLDLDDAGVFSVAWRRPPEGVGGWAPGHEAVVSALERSRTRALEARFGPGAPRAPLAESDVADFVVLALARSPGGAVAPGARGRTELRPDPFVEATAKQVLRLTAIEPRVAGTPSGEKVLAELERVASSFGEGELARARRERRPGAELYDAAARAYGAWLGARGLAIPEARRGRVLASLARALEVTPELDGTALALDLHRQVAQRGVGPLASAPSRAPNEPCRMVRREGEGELRQLGDCAGLRPAYRVLLASASGRSALVTELARATSPEAFAPVIAGQADPARLLPALEPTPALLQLALRTYAAEAVTLESDPIQHVEEWVSEAWSRLPALRPTLLFAATSLGTRRGDLRLTGELARKGGLDAVVFAAFLSEGPRAIELVPRMWESLPAIDAKFELLAPHLERWLASRDPRTRRPDLVKNLADLACASPDREGRRVLRVLLERQRDADVRDTATRLARCDRR